MIAPDGTVSIGVSTNCLRASSQKNIKKKGVSTNLVHEINKNLQALPGDPMKAEKFTMFRVPAHIRQKYKELYEPRMVSIGPYYNGNDALKAMEKHKLRYLRDYLSRNTKNSLKHCISELRGLESPARRCYFEEVKLKSNEFVMMMLLDGCFIIEFLIKFCNSKTEVLDTIFDVGWILPVIRSDLLLLENQIPFFVIQKLFGLLTYSDAVPVEENVSVSTPAVPAPLVNMLLGYLSEKVAPSDLTDVETKHFLHIYHLCDSTDFEIKHILHLYHLCYVPSLGTNELSARTCKILGWLNPIKVVFVFLTRFLKLFRRTKSTNGRSPRTIPSATALIEAGVIFKCAESKNFLDIKFQNGTLEIPFIPIEETRRSRLLNLVSFEQLDNNLPKNLVSLEQDKKLHKNLTSYACFMGGLFKNARDVILLQEKGIVDNLLATDEELVSFFNWLTECSYLNYNTHYLKELFIDVNKYYMDDWHRWKAKLKRDYFSNPWSTISFTAAFVLLALTVVQTVYTILSYY